MLNRITVTVLTALILSACNQKGKYYAPDKVDSSTKTSYKADSTGLQAKPVKSGFNEKELELFCNIEIAPYCVLLPLTEFKEDYNDQSVEKAQHKFLLKKDSTNFTSIELQAFTIDKKNYYNTALFYKRDKGDVEEGGLGIDTSYMDETNHFYVIKGYLPNYMNMRFVQVNWILEDRIAVYFNYDEKEASLWNDRIAAIIKRGVAYKE